MRLRLLLFAGALTALLAGFAVRALFFAPEDLDRPLTSASARSTAASEIPVLEQRVRTSPDDVDGLIRLAAAYVRRARETADPSFYALADTAVKRALVAEPSNVRALVVAGGLALSRHDFARALELGEQARDLEPSVAAVYGVLTDALIELGRYDQATAAAQAMADRRPDFAALSRVSYIRELHGDLDGAAEAMQQAVDAGASSPQDVVWGRVLLGNLFLAIADIDGAARQYEEAARLLPDDPASQFGLARLAIARGDAPRAEQLLRAAIEQRPLPEYVIALGDLLWSEGRTREAEQQYATVRAIQQLFAANGVDTDIELALFDADHGVDPERTYAAALTGYARRPSIYGADTVAWAAYKAGHIAEAGEYIALARRLATQDPRLAYHAGVIEAASGEHDAAARDIRTAVDAKASLSLRYAAAAQGLLDDLNAIVR